MVTQFAEYPPLIYFIIDSIVNIFVPLHDNLISLKGLKREILKG